MPPVAPSRAGTQPRVIDAFTGVVDEWLRHDVGLKAAVIHERLVAEHGFTANYQRVKEYVRHARPRIAAEVGGGDEPLSGLHRRFEVLPGAQAQVDWGDEGAILARAGVGKVYSFHMTLSYSRDPFSCFTTSTDMATFYGLPPGRLRLFRWLPGQPGPISAPDHGGLGMVCWFVSM